MLPCKHPVARGDRREHSREEQSRIAVHVRDTAALLHLVEADLAVDHARSRSGHNAIRKVTAYEDASAQVFLNEE